MLTVIIFIAVLSVLVIVHELGHFLAAKKAGCNVSKFAIGFPPKLFSFTKGETEYTINLLPLGGYVSIKGENGEESDDPRSFSNKSFAWKSLIISAGVLMNVALGYVLITAGMLFGAPALVDDSQEINKYARIADRELQIIEILPESPAALAELSLGDKIISLNSQPVTSTDELSAILNQATDSDSGEYTIEIKREDRVFNQVIQPERIEQIDKQGIGVGLAEIGTVSYPWYIAPFLGIARTGEILWLIVASFVGIIQELFTTGGTNVDIAGPVGIAVITGQVAKQGFIHLMQFTALLSLNLAIINILPFPALDGGRFALIIAEKIRGKKVNVKLENMIHLIGFAFLMLLVVIVTANDIVTYGGGVWESIKGVFS
jgi:regulator of sigma E protease